MRQIIRASLLAIGLLGVIPPVFAADYYLVVPVLGKQAPTVPEESSPAVSITLAEYALPEGRVGAPYSFELNSVLTVQGDAQYLPEHVAWRLGSGEIPPGIVLQSNGQLSGLPTLKNETGSPFEVIASYKGVEGRQTYTIVIAGVEYSVLDIQTNAHHSCLLAADGSVYCWGSNARGQLGIGTFDSQATPAKVVGLPEAVKSITLGFTHSCALTGSGTVYCWGDATKVGAGEAVVADAAQPLEVQGLVGAVSEVAAGEDLSCALLASGTVQCWGLVRYGGLGDGVTKSSKRAVAVSNLSDVSSLSVGGDFACAIQAGVAYCWGNGGNGRLGNGGGSSSTPILVANLGGASKRVLAGQSHACAVLTSDKVQCWGACYSGRCGFVGLASQTTPAYVVDNKNTALSYTKVYIGPTSGCGLPTTGGSMHCWGQTPWRTLYSSTPITEIPADVKNVSIADGHVCTVYADATAYCAGANTYGQLGDGTVIGRTKMEPVSAPSGL